jgi:hypothetical protein
MVSELDLCQVPKFFRIKLKFFLEKVCWFEKKVVPLHPLSGNDLRASEEKSSLKDLHKTEEVVVQEARDEESLG